MIIDDVDFEYETRLAFSRCYTIADLEATYRQGYGLARGKEEVECLDDLYQDRFNKLSEI